MNQKNYTIMNARNIHFFKIQENRFFERNKFYGFKKIDEERKKRN